MHKMRLRSLAILIILLVSLIPIYHIYRILQQWIQPRQSAARLFLFLLANFVLVLAYTLVLVGVIVKLFPVIPMMSS
jgi:hypothetical protein